MTRAVSTRSRALAAVLAALVCLAAASPAFAETRSLKLYFIHTKERATITFKKNGRYVPGGLKKLNRFLRDWRQKEATKMDPRLFDLLWEVYQASGSRDHIHVVSAYRSPKTNAMLRKRSRGVAKKSQHTLGKAVDFYLPDVPVKKVRQIGMKFQVGGVGYYPKSGSPFVHLDVGSVRSWPRMDRKELTSLFPKGKTLHLPRDGKPLPGYNQALADYKKRVSSNSIQVAGKRSIRRPSRDNNSGGGNLLAGLFGGGNKKEEPRQTRQTVVAAASAPPGVEERDSLTPDLAIVPTPRIRPTAPVQDVQVALAPASELSPEAITAAFRPRLPAAAIPQDGNVALASATTGADTLPVPALRTGGSESQGGVELASTGPTSSEVVLASLLAEPTYAATGNPGLTRQELGLQQGIGTEEEGTVTKLAYVPRPSQRPDLVSPETQALAAAVGEDVPGGLSYETVSGIPVPRPSPFGSSASDEMVALAPVQVALAPPSGNTSGARVDVFAPALKQSAGKRSRPTIGDAIDARPSAVRTEPVLTPTMITHTAFAAHSVSGMDAPVSAPQFVSSLMRTAPDMVHVDGFSTENRIASADRFSGTAVNFQSVARFEVRGR
ncbi:DUF882 domain-containing protein [Hoeflea prorocentri]|uniref:Murein endopeptidase K n=1 Tax=Hoeflea prorocentri TaxID=1922333 RepID=A0A9X3UHA6_9HYPH|nr:DUF882 domain-containing protein [Hoeflea prorocentri]MCY6379263.1 DUF882 domain-containing protein [Hoeflea prorocentri]MDA5397064.1 DUF882 domain-containing protein [Hoeflea prorocentri]